MDVATVTDAQDELRLCGPAPNGLLPARRAEAF
jgi:hypothetical protein